MLEILSTLHSLGFNLLFRDSSLHVRRFPFYLSSSFAFLSPTRSLLTCQSNLRHICKSPECIAVACATCVPGDLAYACFTYGLFLDFSCRWPWLTTVFRFFSKPDCQIGDQVVASCHYIPTLTGSLRDRIQRKTCRSFSSCGQLQPLDLTWLTISTMIGTMFIRRPTREIQEHL